MIANDNAYQKLDLFEVVRPYALNYDGVFPNGADMSDQERCPLPADWRLIFEGSGRWTSAITPGLFNVQGRGMYWKTEQGVSALGGISPEGAWWVSISLPDTIDLNEDYKVVPVGSYVYLFLKRKLYFYETSEPGIWKEVVNSIVLPGNETVVPIPLGEFQGRIYGWYWAKDDIEHIEGFQICRSGDRGKTEMQWELVSGLLSFGQAIKYSMPAFLIGGTIDWHPWIYNDRIWIGTNTLTGVFGSEESYRSSGVEIWESSTGDRDSWSLINEPGFGTQAIVPGTTFRTNQMIQSATIGYDGSGEFLLVGTSSHFAPGGQIWRYDGTGVTGWRNITPPWTYYPLSDFTRRFRGLVSWDRLYAAEGFPSGNLGAYDYITNTWTKVVSGPNTFGPENQGLVSLASGPHHTLYAMTTPDPALAPEQKKVQVWAAHVVCSL